MVSVTTNATRNALKRSNHRREMRPRTESHTELSQPTSSSVIRRLSSYTEMVANATNPRLTVTGSVTTQVETVPTPVMVPKTEVVENRTRLSSRNDSSGPLTLHRLRSFTRNATRFVTQSTCLTPTMV